ncbi:MAG TPA: ABC transporter permease [Candidatus Acidoferrum sp.]|jgi:peptide/nickel transport system permease protein|nr:ABC transporter permease [Candidatus Acidoferrum sp.]
MNLTASAKRNTLLVLFVALHLVVIFPGFFSTQGYAEQNRDLPFSPPTRLHFVRPDGQISLRPFVYGWNEAALDTGIYEADRSQIYPLQFFVHGSPYTIVKGINASTHLFGVESPGRLYLFGTDDFGRDEFSRMLYGGRISILAGWIGAAIALFTGGIVGLISGYTGRWVDSVTMRMVELFMALPWLYLLFAVRAILPLRIETTDTFILLIAIVGIIGWARPARLVRSMVLSAKERNFVLAARAMGASNTHILRKHILPQVYALLLTMAAYLVPQFILAEVTLSFLGLGIGEPVPSWGTLLAELQKYNVLVNYWWMYAPGIALVALFLIYHWASSTIQQRVGVPLT